MPVPVWRVTSAALSLWIVAALASLLPPNFLPAFAFRVSRTGGSNQGEVLRTCATRLSPRESRRVSSPRLQAEGHGTEGKESFVFLECGDPPPLVVGWSAAVSGQQSGGEEKSGFPFKGRDVLDVVPLRMEFSSEFDSLNGEPIRRRRMFLPLHFLDLGDLVDMGLPLANLEKQLTLEALIDTASKCLPSELKILKLHFSLALRIRWPRLSASRVGENERSGTALSEAVLRLSSSETLRETLEGFLQPRLKAFVEGRGREALWEEMEKEKKEKEMEEKKKKNAFSLRIWKLPREGVRLSLVLGLASDGSLKEFGKKKASFLELHSAVPLPPLASSVCGDTATAGEERIAPSATRNEGSYRLISLYRLFDVPNPSLLKEFLNASLAPLGVLGRIYVAYEGVNAQIAIPEASWDSFLQEIRRVPGLEEVGQDGPTVSTTSETNKHLQATSSASPQLTVDCDVSFSEFWKNPPFDALHIRVRKQVLRDGFEKPLDWSDCGEEVSPSAWHCKLTQLLREEEAERKYSKSTEKEVVASDTAKQASLPRLRVLLDMRNAEEYAVGRFRGARCIDTPTFADTFLPNGPLEKALVEAGVKVKGWQDGREGRDLTEPSEVEALIYCTGGIRCVKAGAYLKQNLGVGKVTRLKGGILAYKNFVETELKRRHTESPASPEAAQETGSAFKSLFIGSNYLFDHRMSQPVTNDALGVCGHCKNPASHIRNCENRQCGKKLFRCVECLGGSSDAADGSFLAHCFCNEKCKGEAHANQAQAAEAKRQRRMQLRALTQKIWNRKFLQKLAADRLERRLRDEQDGAKAREESGEDGKEGLGFNDTLKEAECLECAWRQTAEQTSENSATKQLSSRSEAAITEALKAAESLSISAENHIPNASAFWSDASRRRVLSALSRVKRPRRILELGTFTGLSALALAEGLDVYRSGCGQKSGNKGVCQEAFLITVEKDAFAAEAARRVFALSPASYHISLVEGDGLLTLRELKKRIQPQNKRPDADASTVTVGDSALSSDVATLNAQLAGLPAGALVSGFDLIFLDADKRAYEKYVNEILDLEAPLLNPSGVLLIDNMLWKKGWVAQRQLSVLTPQQRRHLKVEEALKSLRAKLKKDRRVNHVRFCVLPGLCAACKRRCPTGHP